jgi:glucokinase
MFLVLDIGGTNCRVALFEKDNKRPKFIKYIKLSKNIDESILDITELVKGNNIDSITLGVAGVIDPEKYMLSNSPHLKFLQGINLKELFNKYFDCPFYVFNDTYLACLGEAYSNNYRKDFWYINWGSGIGGSLAKWENDKWEINSSEPGHMILETKGPICTCGQKGCWDRLAGGKGIVESFKKLPKDLILSDWKEIIPYMSSGLLNIIAIAKTDLIILGGGIALNQPLVVDLIEKDLCSRIKIFNCPIVLRTKLSDLAAIYGGFYFLNQRV